MRITKQSRREAKQLLRCCLTPQGVDEAKVRQVVAQVIERKPRGYLAVLSHFLRLVKLDVARRMATVESAIPLTDDLQAGVRTNLQSLYGPAVQIQFRTNPGLIGGLRVRVGSDVYDGSVHGRLNAWLGEA